MPGSDQLRSHCKHTLAIEVLKEKGHLRLAAFGYSMLPTLWPGDLLAIEKQTIEQIQPGEVVLFARHGRFFIHRTLRVLKTDSETRLLTRGDAMPHPDVPVRGHELLGRVVGVKRGRKHVAIPGWSLRRRYAGLMLAYSSSFRSVALRWHTWRSRTHGTRPELARQQL
jgi:hypothetical protein